MRAESSVTSVSWIPSEAVGGPMKVGSGFRPGLLGVRPAVPAQQLPTTRLSVMVGPYPVPAPATGR